MRGMDSQQAPQNPVSSRVSRAPRQPAHAHGRKNRRMYGVIKRGRDTDDGAIERRRLRYGVIERGRGISGVIERRRERSGIIVGGGVWRMVRA